MQDQAKKLAEEHWSYVGEVVKQGSGGIAYLTHDQIIDIIKFHYLSAFVHGFKHGVEALQNRGGLTTKEYEEIIAEYGEPGNYE